jgi:hypothetical protein
MTNTPPRNRIVYGLLIGLVIVTGMASRAFPGLLPSFVGKYPGDVLWGLMVFLLFGFAAPRITTGQATLFAIVFSVADEVSQLYHAPWINRIRHTTPGHLVLGDTFSWGDIACYVAGIAVGAIMEWGRQKTAAARIEADRIGMQA